MPRHQRRFVPRSAPPRPPSQDIYSLFHLQRPFKFISKTSNFMIPIVGWSMFLTGAPAAAARARLPAAPFLWRGRAPCSYAAAACCVAPAWFVMAPPDRSLTLVIALTTAVRPGDCRCMQAM